MGKEKEKFILEMTMDDMRKICQMFAYVDELYDEYKCGNYTFDRFADEIEQANQRFKRFIKDKTL